MLRLADAWDVAPVLAAVARALAAAPPDALGWSVAAEAAGVVAGRRLGAALDPLYRAVQVKREGEGGGGRGTFFIKRWTF